MSTELREGQRGSGTSIYYPKVSSCLTVSCMCAGIIYGMHGVQKPVGDQRSIREMLFWLQGSTQSLRRDQLIIACDLNFWQNDGRGISQFFGEKATDFNDLADYLQVTRKGMIDGAGTYGACKLVHVGSGAKYFNTKTSSASFTVDASGLLT